MIRAYLDESGQSEKDWVVIAGHAGYEESWTEFTELWNGALGQQRKRIHMRELRWNNPSTKKLLERLGPIPSKCLLNRVVGATRVTDYADLIEDTPGKIFFDGYMNALFVVVIDLLLAIPANERIEIFFEQQDRYSELASATMEEISKMQNGRILLPDGTRKLANWEFRPKDSTMLFDQADFLCYAQLQHLRDRQSKKAKWSSSILGDGHAIGEVLNRQQIRSIIKQHDQGLARKLPKTGEIWK